jgi:hypothetical protein
MSQFDQQQNPVSSPAAPKSPIVKTVIKIVIIFLAVILAITIAVGAFILWPGNVSRQEAMDIALSHVGGGNANWAEIDFENFQRAWSVEVFYDGLVREVYVSRFTGEIIRVEIDRWR